MQFWQFVISIVPLVYLFYQEYLSAAARAREENREFEINQAELQKIVEAATTRWISRNAEDSRGAGKAWDASDDDKGNQT